MPESKTTTCSYCGKDSKGGSLCQECGDRLDAARAYTDRESAARKMWWALNSLIPCVTSRHPEEINEGREAMNEWLRFDSDPEEWS